MNQQCFRNLLEFKRDFYHFHSDCWSTKLMNPHKYLKIRFNTFRNG